MALVKTLSISVAVLLYIRVGLSIVGIKLKFCKERRKFCAYLHVSERRRFMLISPIR